MFTAIRRDVNRGPDYPPAHDEGAWIDQTSSGSGAAPREHRAGGPKYTRQTMPIPPEERPDRSGLQGGNKIVQGRANARAGTQFRPGTCSSRRGSGKQEDSSTHVAPRNTFHSQCTVTRAAMANAYRPTLSHTEMNRGDPGTAHNNIGGVHQFQP